MGRADELLKKYGQPAKSKPKPKKKESTRHVDAVEAICQASESMKGAQLGHFILQVLAGEVYQVRDGRGRKGKDKGPYVPVKTAMDLAADGKLRLLLGIKLKEALNDWDNSVPTTSDNNNDTEEESEESNATDESDSGKKPLSKEEQLRRDMPGLG